MLIEKIKNYSYLKIKKKLEEKNCAREYTKLLEYYFQENKLNQLQKFRKVPNYFKKILQNWIIIFEKNSKGKKVLAGHAIMCEICYKDKSNLPNNGWSGAVLKSFKDDKNGNIKNTYVGLFVYIEKDFRKKNIATILIEEMKRMANVEDKKLIIPLRPPTLFTQKYCRMNLSEYVKLKDKEGYHIDFWVKLHLKLGAKYLDFSETSHQHEIDKNNFVKLFGFFDFVNTGHYVVNILGGFHNVFFEKKREKILINQGCIWVQHLI